MFNRWSIQRRWFDILGWEFHQNQHFGKSFSGITRCKSHMGLLRRPYETKSSDDASPYPVVRLMGHNLWIVTTFLILKLPWKIQLTWTHVPFLPPIVLSSRTVANNPWQFLLLNAPWLSRRLRGIRTTPRRVSYFKKSMVREVLPFIPHSNKIVCGKWTQQKKDSSDERTESESC